MMRVVIVLALAACSGSDRRSRGADGPLDSGTTGTTSSFLTPLGVPTWTPVLQDDVSPEPTDQHHPTHGRTNSGSHLVVWDEAVASETWVMGRAFGAEGQALGEAQQIGAIGSVMARPDAWALHDGAYAVTWHSRLDVFLRKVDATGLPLGAEVQVNDVRGVDPDKGQPDVTTLEDGTLVVVYHFSDPSAARVGTYWMRRFEADLTPIGDEVPVADSQQVGSPPDVDALPDGGWTIAWSTRDDSGGTLHLDWFDASGTWQHSVRVDDSAPELTPSRPNLATLPDGTVAVTWRVQTNEGEGLGVYGRIYNPDRTPRTEVFELQADSQRPSVAAGPGVFLFSWEPPVSTRVKARAYDARDGRPLEEMWDPLPASGSEQQHRPQASFHSVSSDRWQVVVTGDRGDVDERQLARAVWELTFAPTQDPSG